GDVDVEIAVAAVLPHDLPLVHRLARSHEEHPARLKVIDGVGGGASPAVRDEGAVGALGNVALPLRVAVEEMVEEPGAPRVREKFRAVADEPARGQAILQPAPSRA